MVDNIINRLFIEAQNEISKQCLADDDYLSNKKKTYDIEKELMTDLSDIQKTKIKDFINSLITIDFIECKQNFYYGFKIGAALIIEIFSK